ncbi:MAG: hypothetical protein GVY16_03595 [Planctomycetes bacterium]|jgi:hypothetical protein|nr:hypothetical protein [Phycisphaerae bacterium]NBB94803.1 hypothetical protein [Planctomycetota bacterium]
MFETLSRSWEYAKMSYGLAWRNKQLLIFPIISGIAAILVTASFFVPLHRMGALTAWAEAADQSQGGQVPISAWITLFCYYVASYFVIVFFNSALVSCAMRAMQGQPVRIKDGLAMAAKRWHAILCWAIVSAVVGVILRLLESHKKIGRLVAALLGTAWTAMTFFVVPIIVIDNRGPFRAIGDSVKTLKSTWGTALVGNFSLGFISFLIFLPVLLLAGLLIWVAINTGAMFVTVMSIAGAIALIVFVASLGAAADMVFKALLFSYATGKELPEQVQAEEFSYAFRPAEKR